MEYAIISDIPTPWREPVFERVYNQLDGAVDIVYFKGNEKRRLWTFAMGSHPKTILKAITITNGGTERFLNLGIIPFLLKRRPRIALIFACIKDPSGWLAMVLCRLLGTKIALLDDSWMGRDQGIGVMQRWARKLVYNSFGDAFIGTSRQTLTMFNHYNRDIQRDQCFLSHLVADNDYFRKQLECQSYERRYDLMFSGRITGVKNPTFFAEVCSGVKSRLGKCRVLIIGEGEEPLKHQMRQIFDQNGVAYEFAGFIPHADLPAYYAQCRLLLLPTSADCWGVVLNEAMISGTPVITTNGTAAAGELVIHNGNGYVLPLELNAWISAASDILSNNAKWESFSQSAKDAAKHFNYERAAAGILSAFAYLDKQGDGTTSVLEKR
jgi:glycosyltransferase involved in cell wall biosynthesis